MPDNPLMMRGDILAAEILDATGRRVRRLIEQFGVRPVLATVLVGDDPASAAYVRMKERRCREIGMNTRSVVMTASSSTAEVCEVVSSLSDDAVVHGILVQHPVGDRVDERAVFDAIDPRKDVDGVTSTSFAALSLGRTGHLACTPGGILRLLDHHGVDPSGMHAVVVGRSDILGRPVAALMLSRDATVTVCHSATRGLERHVASADLLIAAVGRPRFIDGGRVRPGAVVVDAGYNPGPVGDVDHDGARRRASMITPVPGGVGPMTVAMLVSQTMDAAESLCGSGSVSSD
ncbi:bifunctional 5,10-methylenetetrahydrofolate dehydrogenase/5,10-methenyltetrahydrofolate cyclohydrolase [Williamsia sp. SKLECPSW1]